jgi:hypothetical protein
MGKRRRRRFSPRCRGCGLLRLPDETFVRGLWPACLDVERRQKRSDTGARLWRKRRTPAPSNATGGRTGCTAASEAKGWSTDPLSRFQQSGPETLTRNTPPPRHSLTFGDARP